MNRSILIVICDFLLVSLLAFSTVDINKVTDEGTPRNAKIVISDTRADAGRDVVAVMRTALDEERRNRDQLMGRMKAEDFRRVIEINLGGCFNVCRAASRIMVKQGGRAV